MMIGMTMKIDEDPAPVGTHGTVRCRIEKLQFRAVREAEMPPCRGRRSSSRFTEYPRYRTYAVLTTMLASVSMGQMFLGPRVLYMVVFCSRHALPISKPHTHWSPRDPEIHTTRSGVGAHHPHRSSRVRDLVVDDVNLSLSLSVCSRYTDAGDRQVAQKPLRAPFDTITFGARHDALI